MSKVETPKFYLSSFSGAITMQMNAPMALALFRLILSTPDVSKELYAASEKIKTQLYHMHRLEDVNAIITELNASSGGSEEVRGSSAGEPTGSTGVPDSGTVEVAA